MNSSDQIKKIIRQSVQNRLSKFLPQISLIILVSHFIFLNNFAVAADTIKICAIRVEFVEDDNPRTSGNGKFMIDTVTTDQYAIDPAPHDKDFFQDQITAVSNYFKNVSSNRLEIGGAVFPAEQNQAYQLPNVMAHYNPNTTDEEINQGLSSLFVDAVQAADNGDSTIHFSNYDLVVVFHAGIGKDINLGYDPTPQDIPSLFLSFEFLQKHLGGSFSGIPVRDGVIKQGILLPETENREEVKVALTGIAAANVGSYLGLYDLFSSTEQRSGIGRFGLMDFGLMNLNGLVPAVPCAFTRTHIGWDTPLNISAEQNQIEIALLHSENPLGKPTVIKIPINEDEYFLLEFRGDSNLDIDKEFAELAEGRNVLPTYKELLMKYHSDEIAVSENGVILEVADYDMGIGGSGILIWHIDEKVIREKAAQNKINDDPGRRGVDLEEADGSQDIGQVYTLFDAGYLKELGWFADFWFSNRPDDLKDYELYTNEFSSNSTPDSRANLNKAKSHITLSNFNANQSDIMTFDFSRGITMENFPLSLTPDNAGKAYIVTGRPQGAQNDFVFILTRKGEIFAVGDSSHGLFYPQKRLIGNIGLTDDNFSLTLGDAFQDGFFESLYAASADSLYGFDLTQTTGDSMAQLLFPAKKLGAQITSPIVTAGPSVYAPCSNDSVYLINKDGQTLQTFFKFGQDRDLVINNYLTNAADYEPGVLYEAHAALKNDGKMYRVEYNHLSETFRITNLETTSLITEFDPPVDSNGEPAIPQGQFNIIDLDGNGAYDILYQSKQGIYALNTEGVLLNGFPIRPLLTDDEQLVGTPLLYDKDFDGIPEIISSTSYGQLIGFTAKGKILEQFPLAAGGEIASTHFLIDINNDQEAELGTLTVSGSLYMWRLEEGDLIWPMENANPNNNVLITAELEYKPLSADLLPPGRAYNYPNPNKGSITRIRYYLNEDADVNIRIFNAAGIPVDEFTGPGHGHNDNEIIWDVSAIASGVYLCQIEAKSASRTGTSLIKILVVH